MKSIRCLENGRRLWKKPEELHRVSISSVNNAKKKDQGIIQEATYLKDVQKVTIDDIPGPWPSLPLMGTSWQYTKFGPYKIDKLHEANVDKFKRYGRISKEEFIKGCPMVQLFDPSDFETVFRNQARHPVRPGIDAVCQYRLSKPEKYRSVGLTNAQGEEWYELRNALTPILMKMKTIVGYLSQQNEVCQDFIKLLHRTKDANTSIIDDFQGEVYKLALESVSMLCLDTRLGCLDPSLNKDSEAYQTISATQGLFTAFQMLYYGLPLWKFYKTPGYKLLEETETILYSTVSRYIDKAMEKLKIDPQKDYDRESILESLVSAVHIHPKDVRMTIIDFIVAGIDTVSNSLTYVFYHLAKNQDVQQKLYEEINRVLPNKSPMTAESLSSMPYLKATIKEAFRINPTVPGIVRVTNADHNLSGYEVPKNTLVFCHSMVSCKLPEFFDNPECFCPERWLSGKKSHPFSLLPFGHGARSCVGRRFAEQEMYATVSTILQHFRIESAQETLGSVYRFLVVPENKLSLKLISRS